MMRQAGSGSEVGMTTAMVKQELAVASFSTVYDLEQVETALSDLNDGASEALRAT